MALNWDIQNIEDYGDVCYLRDDEDSEKFILSPITETLIFSCISVKMGEITEDNWLEFYGRLKFAEQIHGSFLIRPQKEKKDWGFTKEEVKAHIGLKTNVTTDSRKAFLESFDSAIAIYKNK
ncbi:MAG: hypothetical protein FJZ43_04855 [Candidatus Staskawiczbacteria bacterium]|nr:hypothetical protein [Candidatus Staskawiczbacteria bacterium]